MKEGEKVAFDKGYEARGQGLTRAACPYGPVSGRWDWWQAGYSKCAADLAEARGAAKAQEE